MYLSICLLPLHLNDTAGLLWARRGTVLPFPQNVEDLVPLSSETESCSEEMEASLAFSTWQVIWFSAWICEAFRLYLCNSIA